MQKKCGEVKAKTDFLATFGQPKDGMCPGLGVRPKSVRFRPSSGFLRFDKRSETTAGAKFVDTLVAAGKPRHAVARLRVKAHHQPRRNPTARLRPDFSALGSARFFPSHVPPEQRTLPGSPCLDFITDFLGRHGRLTFQRTDARIESS